MRSNKSLTDCFTHTFSFYFTCVVARNFFKKHYHSEFLRFQFGFRISMIEKYDWFLSPLLNARKIQGEYELLGWFFLLGQKCRQYAGFASTGKQGHCKKTTRLSFNFFSSLLWLFFTTPKQSTIHTLGLWSGQLPTGQFRYIWEKPSRFSKSMKYFKPIHGEII